VTGSSYIPIVVPIVAFVGMTLWLGMIFHADRHPGYWRRTPPHSDGSTPRGSRQAAAVPARVLTDAGVHPEKGEHERIEEHATGAGLR
jgi:hypothetical protein